MEKLKPLGDALGKVFEAVSPALEKFGEAVIKIAEAAIPVLVEVVKILGSLFEAWRPVILSVVNVMKDTVVPVLGVLAEMLKGFGEALKKTIEYVTGLLTMKEGRKENINKALKHFGYREIDWNAEDQDERKQALEKRFKKLKGDQRTDREKKEDKEIESKRREMNRLMEQGKHGDAQRVRVELERMIDKRGPAKGTGPEKKKEQEHLLAMPKEMTPHFTGIDSARKEFQLAALGKDQFETEMLRIAREQYEVAKEQLEESRRGNKRGGPRAESDNDRRHGGGKIDWGKAGDWAAL
jgi:hypothetical protein